MFSSRVFDAAKFAIQRHGDQKYDGSPYSIHLLHVVEVLSRFEVDSESLLTAAFLHDVVEDTDTTIEEVQTRFGPVVASLVEAVTDPKGGNRAWRHSIAYPLISATQNAVILKLADRIANVEYSIASGSKFGMYKKEYESFKQYLRNAYTDSHDLCDEMWDHLDHLMENNE